jgi:hypothetical protein
MADVIKLHNHLGQARYRMSLTEQKLFIYAVRHLDQSQADFSEVSFRLKDFAEEAGLSDKPLYREIESISENIMKTVIKSDRPENQKGFLLYNLTQRCEYLEGEGILKFRFNDDMRPLLLQLQQHYFLQNPEVIEFRSWYTIRLYDILKSEYYKNKPIRIALDKLKTILGIAEKYPRFNNMKQFVLDPAVSEINEKSEMQVSWDRITRGKKVLEIIFQVSTPEQHDTIVTIDELGPAITWSLDGKFNPEDVLELRKIAAEKAQGMDPEEYIHRNFAYMAGQEVKKPFDYLKKALESDFANATNQITMFDQSVSKGASRSREKKPPRRNGFHNFEGRLANLNEKELEDLINKRKRKQKEEVGQ